MKRFKPMICPVCGEVYFSEPLEDFNEEEMEMYNSGNAYCQHCGWIYDLNQFENPDSHEGFNKLSLNEYKKDYEEKIKNNPDYDYEDEHMPAPTPHKCPVCGEYEFENEASYDICPVCGWEDDDYYAGGGANEMSLDEAIEDFKNKRQKNPNYRWENDQENK